MKKVVNKIIMAGAIGVFYTKIFLSNIFKKNKK